MSVLPKRRSFYLKWTIILLTSILMLIGVGMFAAVGLVKLRYSHEGVNLIDIGIFILASLLCLVSLLGYWGTSQHSTILLKFFIFFIVVITCLIIMVDIMVFTHPRTIRELLTKLWPNLNDHGRIEFQKLFRCCDVPASYNSTKFYHSSYDVSCYKIESDNFDENLISNSLRRQDCVQALINFLHSYMSFISAITGGLLILNVMIIFLSAMLVVDKRDHIYDDDGKTYFSFPVVSDVILWRRRSSSRRLTEAIESGIFELPPTFPTELPSGPILQAYNNSIDKSMSRGVHM